MRAVRTVILGCIIVFAACLTAGMLAVVWGFEHGPPNGVSSPGAFPASALQQSENAIEAGVRIWQIGLWGLGIFIVALLAVNYVIGRRRRPVGFEVIQ
jgi:hypothetical protein